MHATHRTRIYRTLHTAAGSTLTQPSLWRPLPLIFLVSPDTLVSYSPEWSRAARDVMASRISRASASGGHGSAARGRSQHP